MNPQRRLLWGLYAFIGIIAAGTGGYMAIEGWSFLDALYMTIITITTVGYAEVHPLSAGGRIFGIFLIVGGVGGALYAITGIIQYILEGYFRTTWGRRRMKAKITNLKEHFILCGYGRVGQEIARTFNEEGMSFVIIDSNPENIAQAEQTGYPCLLGDATNDDFLKEAGIERARGLVAATGSDADNTYITLSARQLNSKLFIEARAGSKEAEKKLKRTGADRVVSPDSIGGRRMAMLALHPTVVDFIDTVVWAHGREFQLETVDTTKLPSLISLTMEEVRTNIGVTILAIRKKGGKLVANPPDEEKIEEGDQLIIIGTKERLASLEEALEGVKPSRSK